MISIVLSSLETVYDTVQYCIFSLLYHLLRIRLKRQDPLLSYVREKDVFIGSSTHMQILQFLCLQVKLKIYQYDPLLMYVGKSISKLQMDIELKQTRVLI
jgi:hypothetical protein